MIKKVCFLCFVFVMIWSAAAFAEDIQYNVLTNDGFVLPESSIEPLESQLGDPLHSYSTCYLPVTYKTLDSNGNVTNEVTYYELVANIKYRYRVSKNSDGKYTGGVVVVSAGYPEVTPANASHLNISLKTTAAPTGSVAPINNGAGYRVTFYGGTLRITYNAIIYKNINNVTTGVESSTVTRAFSHTVTGP